MKTKKKKILLICASVLLVMVLLFAYAYKSFYHPRLFSTWFDRTNTIDEKDIEKVSAGMTYGEVIRAIGKANGQTGSGFFILTYRCSNGKELNLYLGYDEAKKFDSYYVTDVVVRN